MCPLRASVGIGNRVRVTARVRVMLWVDFFVKSCTRFLDSMLLTVRQGTRKQYG